MTPYGGSLTPASIQEPFTYGHSTNDENSARTADRRTLYGEESPPSPINILREISNTTYRKRKKAARPAITTLFQDADASRDSEEPHTRSRYQENNNEFSPSPHTGPPLRNMKLREGSLNERTAPVASTRSKQGNEKGAPRPKPRISSSQVAQQIKDLEDHNHSLTTRLDELTSPKETKARAAKLRELQAQVKEQARTIEEWERNFQERVKDARYENQVEQRLQTRIRALEEECELKGVKIEQLEWELDAVRAEVREVESLKSTNQDLDRRLVGLTELLAQSPTRPDFASITLGPGSGDPTKRTPRPRSLLLPRMHSSPTSAARHSAGFADAIAWHGRNIGSISSLSISENPEDEQRSPFDNKQPPSILSEPSSRPVSMLSVPENADSSQAATFLPSRPASMISNSSFGASWCLPAPIGSSERSQSVGRSRKMRRFPSGQSSLKPLILPVAAAVGSSLPVSAPATSNLTTPSGDMLRSSRFSLDPTTAFLSSIVDETSPFTTPTQLSRRRSLSLARRQTLDALEGRSRYAVDEEDEKDREAQGDVAGKAEASIRYASVTPSPCVMRTQRRSLQMELEQAEAAEKAFLERGPSATSTLTVPDPSTKPPASSFPSQPDSAATPLQPQRPTDDGLHLRRVASNSSDTPRPPKTTLPVPSSPPNPHPPPSALLPSTLPFFTRLTGLLSALNPDPLLLAKRILNNACHTTSHSSAGGVCWWLLGLLLGFRRKQKGADVRVVEEEAIKRVLREGGARGGDGDGEEGFDWRMYSAEASKKRRARELWRDLRCRVVAAGLEGDLGEDGEGMRGRRLDERGGTGEGEAAKGDVKPPHAEQEIVAQGELDRDEEAQMEIENPFRCNQCIEPPSRRSLRLWLRFSVAMGVAFCVALKHGPGKLLVELPGQDEVLRAAEPRELAGTSRGEGGAMEGDERSEEKRGMRDSQETMVGEDVAGGGAERALCTGAHDKEATKVNVHIGERDQEEEDDDGKEDERNVLHDGYVGWEVTFAETLGPRDFEGTT